LENEKFSTVISFRYGLIISIFLILIYIAILLIFRENRDSLKIFSDLGILFVNLIVIIALFCSVQTLRAREDPKYKVWAVFLVAQTAFLLGDLLWALYEIFLNQNPFPSIADIFYIAYYPIFVLGILMIPRVSEQHHRGLKFFLDMGIILIACLIFFWTFLILPLLQNSQGDVLSNFVSILYIAMDFVLLFALFDLTLDKIKNIRDWTLILLASGVATQIIADIIYSFQTTEGTYISGGLLEIGWVISYVLIALAGLWEANYGKKPTKDLDSPTKVSRPTWIYYMPYGLVILVYIIFSIDYLKLDYQNWILLDLGVGLIILLVVVRQILSINENRNLYLQAQEEIEKRKKTEEVVKKERDRAQRYFSVAGVFMLILDEEGNIQLINQKGSDILGYKSDDIIGCNWFQKFIPSNSRDEIMKTFENLEGQKSIKNLEYGVLNRHKSEKIISWHVTPLKEGGTLSSGEDITRERIRERKEKERIEQTIQRQESLLELTSAGDSDLKSAFKSLTKKDAEIMKVDRVSIWYFNEDKSGIKCKCLYDISKDMYESGGTLYEKDYPTYFKAVQESHNIAAPHAISNPLTKELYDYFQQYNIFSLLDVPIWIRGQPYGILCHEKVNEHRNWTFEDQDYCVALANLISRYIESHERRRVEESIKESLNEKEILLQEIHHRVKNNMQIISSLMSLQSRYLNDETASDVFKESQNRVKSMAIIHEKLYESESLDRINLKKYINSLLSNLISSYMSSSGEINIHTELQDVYLNMDTSIPVGLILNELITNSFKHAFPHKVSGEIHILMELDLDEILLTVKDNGVGIPEGLDLKTVESLGLLLVNSLINQINGTIEIENKNGAIFRLKFKEIKPQI
jgi:PAS domain S-box-containing protein